MKDFQNNRLKKWCSLNLANAITIAGLLTTIWLIIVAITNPQQLWLILVLAGAVGFGDWIDGPIARYFNGENDFGNALDRLRDLIFAIPTLIILTWYHRWILIEDFPILNTFTGALAALLILIEILFLVSGGIIIFKKININVQPNSHGKAKMFCEFFTVILCLVSLNVEKYLGFPLIRFSIFLIDLALAVGVYQAIKSLETHYKSFIDKEEPKPKI